MEKLICLLYLLTGLFYDVSAQTIGSPDIQSSQIKPLKIIQKGQGHYFVDFGKDAFGNLELLFASAQADSLVIHLGEKLESPHTIDRKPGGTIRYQKVVLSQLPVKTPVTVKLPVDKRNTRVPAVLLPDSMGVIMPFRYAEIENLKVAIEDVVVMQKVYNYRFNEEASYFTSSDTILNQVWDLCKHTIKATSFAGIYIDGDRERIAYEADAYINQLSHYAVDNEYLLARRTNEHFINSPTWPTEWILHTVPLFYYDYLYTGNTAAISKHYEVLKNKTLMQLERADGLIATDSARMTPGFLAGIGFRAGDKIKDIVDWPAKERDGYEMVKVNTVVNSFYYLNLKLMSEMAGAIGQVADAAFFYRKADMVKKAINDKLLNKATGIYVDGEGAGHSSLHANIFPLAFGIVPAENIRQVVSFVRSRGMACSVYGAQYLLEALYQHGEADYALQLLSSTEGDRTWWNMIKAGSTMTLEAWDIKYKPNLDWNHAWGTAPVNIVARHLWGITPSKPGFAKVAIRPQPGALTFSKIKVPTIKGPIYAEYKQIERKVRLFIVEIPKGMTGEFIITAAPYARIIKNNRVVRSNKDCLQLSEGVTHIKIIN